MISTPSHYSMRQKHIAVSTALSFLVGSAVWIAMLLSGAHTLASRTNGGNVDIAFGPLILNTINKIATDGGYVVSFSASDGLFWYVLGWVALGMIIGIMRGRRSSNV